MVLSKKESCAALVVITLVLMAAASLLADPAWAQAELTVNKTAAQVRLKRVERSPTP